MPTTETGIIYVHDSILKESFLVTLEILGYSGKDELLEELGDFGVIPDTLSENVDMAQRYSLDNLESALTKVVGAESSSLIMINLKRILHGKGWSLAENLKDMTAKKLSAPPLTKLSEVDKQIINALLSHGSRITSKAMAHKLGIPRTTLQRRRDYLENHLLDFGYSLKLNALGLRRVDLLISTGGGGSVEIAEKLLEREEVRYAGTSIGEHTVDLRVEIIVKNNAQLLDFIEQVKSMPNVRDVVWSEIVMTVGRKRSVPSAMVDEL